MQSLRELKNSLNSSKVTWKMHRHILYRKLENISDWFNESSIFDIKISARSGESPELMAKPFECKL